MNLYANYSLLCLSNLTTFSIFLIFAPQTIESDRPCHGEIFETFESTLTNFEAERACWPNYFQPPPPFCRLPLYPTSASAHCALIQRRINLYRDVLAATAKYTEEIFKREDGDLNTGLPLPSIPDHARDSEPNQTILQGSATRAPKNRVQPYLLRASSLFVGIWLRISWVPSSS